MRNTAVLSFVTFLSACNLAPPHSRPPLSTASAYREGVVGYIEVLDAERSLFVAEQALIQIRRLQADNMVTLYVALGGGIAEAVSDGS